jgi:predicted nucleotidyltransferase
MKISPDFREFIACANERDVRFLIVGGYAVAYYGYPRYTKDLDVWVDSTRANAERILAALEDFGFGAVELEPEDFLDPERVVQLGYPPLRIDLLTSVSGVSFDQCYPNRRIVEIDDVEVPFIGLDDLKSNKRASGRHQDLADLENLE